VYSKGSIWTTLPFNTAYRVVRKWLAEFGGYERGKRKGNLVPSPQNVAKKHHYLQTFFASSREIEGGVHR
jgi:hypothetical protein